MMKFAQMQRLKPKSISYYPYLFQFINSSIWTIFGIISYTLEREDEGFMKVNIFLGLIGVISSTYYLITYYGLAQKSQKESLSDEFNYSAGFLLFIAIISYFYVLEHPKFLILLKKCSSFTSIFMFASTLLNIKTFFTKYKISVMPRLMIIFGSFHSCALFIYSSFVLDDSQYWIPFMISYAVSCLQMAAILVFPCFFEEKIVDLVNPKNNEKKSF
jgi:hypothetical protein